MLPVIGHTIFEFTLKKTSWLAICLVFSLLGYAQELTDEWTGNVDDWSASACGVTISTEVSDLQNGAFTNFSTEFIECAMPNTYSSIAVVNRASLAPFLGYTPNSTGILTFNFSQPILNPILHIDRLGGGSGSNSTSVLLTLTTPGITLQRLSGNGPHFEVTANQITRTPDQMFVGPPITECGPPTEGVAAGSVQLNGMVSTVSFQFEANGTGGNADALEIVWELPCPVLDFDEDGIPDVDDLDDDNDGITDITEQNGIPTLDTDLDGLIDSFDLDSDNDGCNDVLEAGFEDLDGNGTLGTAPDDVDVNGLIINAVDGYTVPDDLNNNLIFDFQEESATTRILQHPLNRFICEGQNTSFEVVVENATSVAWEFSTDNGTTWVDVQDDAIFNGANTEVLSITNSSLALNGQLFRVRVAPSSGSPCDSIIFSISSALTVLSTPNTGENTQFIICMDDLPVDLLDLLGNTVDSGGVWSPVLISGTSLFDPKVDIFGIYSYTIDNGSCNSTSTVQVELGMEVEIDMVEAAEANDMNQIIVTVSQPGEHTYSLDGVNYQDSNIFQNLEEGSYTVYVQSTNRCGIATASINIVNIIDYPKFFTPNEDGVNDDWQVEDNQIANAMTYIFDRYGKLLKVLVGQDERWDGTYRNRRMPTTDYWFKVVAGDSILQKGHFTLKR